MIETLSTTTRIARKDHEDSAGVWIQNCLGDIRESFEPKLTFSEWRAIAKLRANGWKIKAGQSYEESSCKYEGEMYKYRCDPVINKICQKLNLFDNL